MQASSPNDETKQTKNQHKPNNSNEKLNPPRNSISITIKITITTIFFFNHLRSNPPFIIHFSIHFLTQKRAIITTRDSTWRRSSWMVTIRLMWRWTHWTWLHCWRFITIMRRFSWRALDVIRGLFLWSWWWWVEACDIRISFCVHVVKVIKWICTFVNWWKIENLMVPRWEKCKLLVWIFVGWDENLLFDGGNDEFREIVQNPC